MHNFALLVVISIVTVIIRMSPFVVFKKEVPPIVLYLGNVLPYAIMGMLVIYCLREVSNDYLGNLSMILASLITVIAYKISHNTIITIVLATASYMILLH